MNISEHFTLEEMCSSEAAVRLRIDNRPGPDVFGNLKLIVAVMEKIRVVLNDKMIVVHSGYRAPELNLAVGGVATSAHCLGLACDFVCQEYGTTVEVALAILKSDVEYDQLILEYGWVHVGLAPVGTACRHEALTKRSWRSPYEMGINP